jgi:predicted alpha/beta superfamily hydrolase
MIKYEYGNMSSEAVLIQPVDDHDLEVIDNEVKTIAELTERDFGLIAVKVDDWNRDLSPWEAPAVFGNESFGGEAKAFLEELTGLCTGSGKAYYIGGYSLAGLFALWAVYQTDIFAGAAAASPSIWFPGFTEYMSENRARCSAVYLSLGDREEKARNPVMAAVGDRIRQGYELLRSQGTDCVLEWNAGNHFKDPDLRTAKAFAWILDNGQ